jgi:hypothetical protein
VEGQQRHHHDHGCGQQCKAQNKKLLDSIESFVCKSRLSYTARECHVLDKNLLPAILNCIEDNQG